jgi:hypothetical protein
MGDLWASDIGMSKTGYSQYYADVTHKSGWVSKRVAHWAGGPHDPRYLGYFECFNAGEFYEAHDVLEDLWLETRGQPDADFYKALIQLAGGFVHLTMHENPKWPAAGPRLRPAHKLMGMARGYLEKYPLSHHGLVLPAVFQLIDHWRGQIEQHEFQTNPLSSKPPPHLQMPSD